MATDQAASAGFKFDRSKFTKLRTVTLGVLKLRPNQPRIVFIGTPMYQAKKIDAKKEAAIIVRGLDLESGEEGIIMCSAVMRSELFDQYGATGYVGKVFEVVVTKGADRSGDNPVAYNHVSITELGAPDDFKAPKFDAPDPATVKAALAVIEGAAKARAAAAEAGSGKK